MYAPILLLGLALFVALPARALPPEIEADRLAIKAKAALEAKDHAQAVESFERMEKLNVPLPQSFHYLKGVALNGMNRYGAAKRALEKYLAIAGTTGKFYKEALEAINRAEVGMQSLGEPEMIDLPQHGFAIGKYEVTQAQWRKVMGKDPPRLRFPGCDGCPVEKVSWNDAQIYLEKLSRLAGKRYRLPKDAEWLVACLGGVAGTKFCGGNELDQVAWYWEMDSPNPKKTHPVGGKKPNGFGLYDMSGNVSEWMQDCPGGDCAQRLVRGGGFCSFWDGVLADFKYGKAPDYLDECTGLRVAHDLD